MNVQTSSGESVTGSLRDVCGIFCSVEFFCCTCPHIMRVETHPILEEINFLNVFLQLYLPHWPDHFFYCTQNFGNETKFTFCEKSEQ
jgi:hypothetical protein